MGDRYILEGHTAVLAEPMVWARWLEANNQNRVVAKTATGNGKVSTVFLGTDHRFGTGGPPQIFETLVFGGPLADEMERYATWEEAEAGHARMVRRVTSLSDLAEHALKTAQAMEGQTAVPSMEVRRDAALQRVTPMSDLGQDAFKLVNDINQVAFVEVRRDAAHQQRLLTLVAQYRDALFRMVKAHEDCQSDSEGRWPVPDSGCIECTAGTVPDQLNTGRCAYHHSKRLLG